MFERLRQRPRRTLLQSKHLPNSPAWGLAMAAALALGIGALALHRRQSAVAVAIGIDLPLTAGGAIDPSDKNTADLYKELHPGSPIQLQNVYNTADPRKAAPELQQAMRQGIRFFINTQASNNALECLGLFASSQALTINVSATSTRLSDRDDYFLRIVPDLRAEQSAIARIVRALPGHRLLVIQDTGNLAYTAAALQVFRQQLGPGWQLQVAPLRFTAYRPQEIAALLGQPFDALYILGGGFLPAIGNMAQQFHHAHPQAPIVLTPWARSPLVLANAGPATARLLQISPYPDAVSDAVLNRHLQRFRQRFGYEPYAMSIGTYQALELLDQAFARGYRTPSDVRGYLLSGPVHHTSLGPVRFNRYGDTEAVFHAYTPTPAAAGAGP